MDPAGTHTHCSGRMRSTQDGEREEDFIPLGQRELNYLYYRKILVGREVKLRKSLKIEGKESVK